MIIGRTWSTIWNGYDREPNPFDPCQGMRELDRASLGPKHGIETLRIDITDGI